MLAVSHSHKSQRQRLVKEREREGGRGRHRPRTECLCPTLSWGFQVNCSTVRTSSQDVDNILSQEGGPVHESAEGENRFARLAIEPGGP